MATITINTLPVGGSVTDATAFATESGNVTQQISGTTLKNYMTTLPNLTVAGTIAGVLSTASQPNVTAVGNLTSVITTGQIISTLATGVAPMTIASNTFVPNLYTARSALADATTDGVTISTPFSNIAGTGGDVTISGNVGNILATLNTVNVNAGVWGGRAGTTYYVPQFRLNAKGLLTFASNVALNLDFSTQTVNNLLGTDNQISVSSNIGTVQISLPTQVNLTNLSAAGNITAANVASTTVFDNGKRVLTAFTVTPGTGMSGGGTVNSVTPSVTVTNAGVVSVAAGTGISVSASTGAVTINNTGVTAVTGGSGISVSAATGGVTISAAGGSNGYGTRYISSGTPSGGNDGDIWYRI
jgi:hypothetical protein